MQDVTERLDLGLDPGNSQSKRFCLLAQRIKWPRGNYGYLCEYNRVIRNVKISDPNDTTQPDFSDILPSTWSMQVLKSVGARTNP